MILHDAVSQKHENLNLAWRLFVCQSIDDGNGGG
jgi:hypothetical protein